MENFFKDNDFLGMDKLPSLNLNAIQTMLSLRFLAFHALANFRHDLGPGYNSKTPEIIHREFNCEGMLLRSAFMDSSIKQRLLLFSRI